MKRPLVVFGDGDIAQLAHFYFSTESEYEIVAFTVDSAYLTGTTFCGLPVIAFEEISKRYDQDQYELFIALSYSKLNAARKEKYLPPMQPIGQCKEFGPALKILQSKNDGEMEIWLCMR